MVYVVDGESWGEGERTPTKRGGDNLYADFPDGDGATNYSRFALSSGERRPPTLLEKNGDSDKRTVVVENRRPMSRG